MTKLPNKAAQETGQGRFGQRLTLVVLGLLAVCVYAYRLYSPREPYFDEVHYVQFIRDLFAGRYVETLSVHPPLWHFLTALGMKVFGDHPWTWRLVSVIAGLGILPVLYRLTKRITGDPQVALLAVFFWFFDCLSLTQARVAMMNSLLLLFMLVSTLFFLEALDGKKCLDKRRLLWVGLFFGLALTTKLIAGNMVLFFVPMLVIYAFRERSIKTDHWLWLGLCFVLVPLAVFLCVHLAIPFFQGRTFADIWNITMFHIHYNMTTQQVHVYMSDWWTWPMMVRPTWAVFESKNSVVEGIVFIGNPLIFWSIPLAMGFAVWEFLKRRSNVAGIILLGFCSQWLCYAFISRLKFFHYFYLAMPFVAMALALLAKRLWGQGMAGRWIVAVFLILTTGMFVYWYPLLTGLPISQRFFYHHMWFRSWI